MNPTTPHREGERTVHCWQDYWDHIYTIDPENYWTRRAEAMPDMDTRPPGATCMLLEGHDGPHEWTPDSDIGMKFSVSP